ncbi:polysaccharide deacetylase family protein [Seohaeicola saemankumensis]|uniref:Chitooligosaccharide deacetylase n=1 Tax=Seohaeicola saemankumensis TaxID=481181 RepID=A0ABW3TDG6_9RHOB
MAATFPPPILRRLRRVPDGTVAVLCYHTLGTDDQGPDVWTALRIRDFRAQIKLLRRWFDVVDMDTAFGQAQVRTQGKPLAVVTFDDGDIGLYRHLIPFLAQDQVPVTVYVATSQIQTGVPYWFDRVMNALQAPIAIDLTLDELGKWRFGVQSGAARWQLLGPLLETMKTLVPERRALLTEKIEAQAGRGAEQRAALGPMSVAQLQALAACPGVTIGAHSHCHNLLDQIPMKQARESVLTSRALLQEWTGQDVRHFAYPNGNHNAALRGMLRDAGFATAVALDNGLALPGGDAFALSRIAVGRHDPMWRIKLRLAGL